MEESHNLSAQAQPEGRQASTCKRNGTNTEERPGPGVGRALAVKGPAEVQA